MLCGVLGFFGLSSILFVLCQKRHLLELLNLLEGGSQGYPGSLVSHKIGFLRSVD